MAGRLLIVRKTEDDLIKNVAIFLEIFTEVGFKIHTHKTTFFLKETVFFGRILSENGVKYDPRQFDVLLGMQRPKMDDQLQQFLCVSNWMRN